MDIEHALTRVRTAAAQIDESLAAVTAARQALQREALRALMAFDGDDERHRDLVRALYWEVPALPAKTLEAVVGGTAAEMRALAAPGPLVGSCDGCGAELRATSRTQLAKPPDECPNCEKERRRREREHRQQGWYEDDHPAPPPDWFMVLDDDLDELPSDW